MSGDGGRIGLVDGSVESDSRTFHVVLDAETLIQLDELVAVTTELPGGATVTHYGIVTELRSRFEGADLPSDTGRVVDRTLPAEHVRRAEVRVLRVVPELFVAPHAGSPATRAAGEHRTVALFEDEMTRGKLPVGLDLGGAPVYADMRFVDGRSGGHVSISGISGVATKTSYALFLLYLLLETEQGMDLLGGRAGRESVRALVFNTKGEDLLHLDRANAEFAGKPQEREKWRALGIDRPGPFRSVRLYAPRQSDATSHTVSNVKTRKTADVNAYGWTPELFIREQLLQFCFTSDDERSTQVGFVEQQVRIQLLRRLRRLEGDASGAVVIADVVPPNTSFNPDRLAERDPAPATAGAGHVMRDFGDLIDLLEGVASEDDDSAINEWFGRTQAGTRQAFLRRLLRLRRHVGPLIGCGLEPVSAENAKLHVVDISTLHDDAQRFVVGALLDRVWREKQGTGRTPAPLRRARRAEQVRPGPRLLAPQGPAGRHRRARPFARRAAHRGAAGGLRRGAGAAAERVAQGGGAARRQRVRRVSLSHPCPARARDPLHARHDGRIAADRSGADPRPLPVPAVRDQSGRGGDR